MLTTTMEGTIWLSRLVDERCQLNIDAIPGSESQLLDIMERTKATTAGNTQRTQTHNSVFNAHEQLGFKNTGS